MQTNRPVLVQPQLGHDALLRFAGKKKKSVKKQMELLRERLSEVKNLDIAASTVSFDRETHLPKKARPARGGVLGTLAELSHNAFTSKAVGKLLHALNKRKALKKLNDVDQALVRNAAEGYDKATKLDGKFVAEMAKAQSDAQVAWTEAREQNDFSKFQPHLEKLVELSKKKAEIYKSKDGGPIYNALLNEFEEGANVKQLDQLFTDLRSGLVPLVKAISESQSKINTDFLKQPKETYGKEKQKDFGKAIAQDLGFDFDAGMIDEVTHPFCTGIDSPNDVRANTRYSTTTPMESIGGIIHELGHGLYEQGVNPKLAGTLLAGGTSLGIHESQSRLYENQVGRSRPFWQHYLPKLRKLFPQALKGVNAEQFYKGINEVKPSLIRVEADEVTYNLHIMVRYELEKALFEDKLPVKDLPQAWNQKMKEYLGVEPQSNAEGVLQDVHWSMGAFGYFPTYTLGNLLSAQLFHKMSDELGKQHDDPGYVQKQIGKGEFKEIREWLRQKVHDVGSMEKPAQLIQRATGEPLTAKYFINYLWDKYSDIYPDIAAKRPAVGA